MATPPTSTTAQEMAELRVLRMKFAEKLRVIATPATHAASAAEPVATPAIPAAATPSIPTAPTAPVPPEIQMASKLTTFFEKFDTEFKKLVGEAPAIEVKIAATLPVATKLLATVLTLTAGAPAAAAVSAIVAKVQTGLVTSSVLIQGAVNDPTVPGILADVTSNLSSIEAAAQITDPATVAKLNSTVAEIAGEVGAIATALPTA
jgi:hypothetical protein